MAPSRNFSSHSDLSQMAVGASELIRVQVFVDGRLEQVKIDTIAACKGSARLHKRSLAFFRGCSPLGSGGTREADACSKVFHPDIAMLT